jgi:tetratricopeptide (TPR) repeat protein
MEIPKHLVNEIGQGNVVLFLGAGASFGAISPNMTKIPNGQELADLIAKKYLGDEFVNQQLTYVSELAISQSNLFDVQKYIYDLVEPFKPAEFHKLIPSFNWRSIYTTNYDYIIEESYKSAQNKIQELSVVIRNTRAQNIHKSENSLPYYKLHGSLSEINDPELPLILTPDQYIDHKNSRERLFNKLLEECYSFTFIFVGYSFSDHDIRAILHLIEQEKEGRPRFYLVGPMIKDVEMAYWEGKKISSLKMSFKEFLEEIDNKIPLLSRQVAKITPVYSNPIYSHFIVPLDDINISPGLTTFINNDIDFVNASISSTNTSPKEFYKGYFFNWDPIIKNLDARRKVAENIIYERILEDRYANIDAGAFFILIQGHAGSGKSVMLKRIAWEAAVSFNKFCIFLKPNTNIRYENIYELYRYIKVRIFIFLDNVISRDEEIKEILFKSNKDNVPITVIGTERTNIWNQDANQLVPFVSSFYMVEYLNDKELNDLIELLQLHHSLGSLENRSIEEKRELLGPRAGRVLLVALYEATQGKPFRELIKDEFESIYPDQAKTLYLTICIMHMLGAYARAGFISRVHGINFARFKEEFFKPLQFIVFDRRDYKINDYIYLTRHPHIAQMVFETVLVDEEQRYNEFIRILTYLDIDYESDRTAFIYLTNAKKLLELFPNGYFIQKLYDEAIKISPNNPKLLQQMAILEISMGNLLRAEEYIDEANTLTNNKDAIILHTIAELSYKKAEYAKQSIEKIKYLDKAIKLCEQLIYDFGPSSFSYHTILKSLNYKLQIELNRGEQESFEKIIKSIEKVFRDSKQQYPNHEFILEVEASFNEIIHNTPEALEILIKAHALKKSSTFITSRLAHIYEIDGNYELASKVLKDTLDLVPNDKELNYYYALILIKAGNSKLNDIIYYLKKSFSIGDNRFQAQFWLARTLYLNNQVDEAKDIFKSLSRVSMDFESKNNPKGIISENGNLIEFKGVVINLQPTYGFAKREMYGDDIYISKLHNKEIWTRLVTHDKIKFNLAFSYYGPIAVNIKF